MKIKNVGVGIIASTCGLFFLYFFVSFFLIRTQSLQSSNNSTTQLVCLVTVPKCGTHLLQKCIMLLSDKKPTYGDIDTDIAQKNMAINPRECFLVSHGFCSNEALKHISQNNMRIFFIYRDPRDQIISFIHYVKKTPSNYLHASFKDKSLDELIYTCIDNLQKEYQERLKWMACPGIYTTTFEKLVGSKGGGSDELQQTEIKNIARHINIELSDQDVKTIADQLFGGTYTFRDGKIGSWKKSFTNQHKAYFKKHAPQLLIDLGYEKDINW